jgi:hypothetical protein
MGSVTATTNGAATPQIARKWLVNAPTTTLVASGRYEPCSDAKGCHGRQVHGEGPAPGDQVEHRRTQDPAMVRLRAAENAVAPFGSVGGSGTRS